MQIFLANAWMFLFRLTNPVVALADNAGGSVTGIATGAGASVDVSGDVNSQIMSVLNPVMDVVYLILRLLGAAFAVWGIVQLIISIKNDREPDSIAKALVTLGVGAVLAIGLPILIKALLPSLGL